MTPLRLRLRKAEFDAVKYGKQNEVVKFASSKRIHYLCFSRMTHDCDERQSQCRACFSNAVALGGYEIYPFDRAIIRRGATDKYITREIESCSFEERNGKMVFVFRFKTEKGGES